MKEEECKALSQSYVRRLRSDHTYMTKLPQLLYYFYKQLCLQIEMNGIQQLRETLSSYWSVIQKSRGVLCGSPLVDYESLKSTVEQCGGLHLYFVEFQVLKKLDRWVEQWLYMARTIIELIPKPKNVDAGKSPHFVFPPQFTLQNFTLFFDQKNFSIKCVPQSGASPKKRNAATAAKDTVRTDLGLFQQAQPGQQPEQGLVKTPVQDRREDAIKESIPEKEGLYSNSAGKQSHPAKKELREFKLAQSANKDRQMELETSVAEEEKRSAEDAQGGAPKRIRKPNKYLLGENMTTLLPSLKSSVDQKGAGGLGGQAADRKYQTPAKEVKTGCKRGNSSGKAGQPRKAGNAPRRKKKQGLCGDQPSAESNTQPNEPPIQKKVKRQGQQRSSAKSVPKTEAGKCVAVDAAELGKAELGKAKLGGPLFSSLPLLGGKCVPTSAQISQISQICATSSIHNSKSQKSFFQIENPTERYCICRMGAIDNANMIACDLCDEWFHQECIGIRATLAKNLKEYYCMACCVRRNLEYLPNHHHSFRYFQFENISLEQFAELCAEGQQIPVKLEELDKLLKIREEIEAWIRRASAVIEKGPGLDLLHQAEQCAHAAKHRAEDNLEELKLAAEQRETDIMKLFIHSFKFPVNIPQAADLLTMLQQRDLTKQLLKFCYPGFRVKDLQKLFTHDLRSLDLERVLSYRNDATLNHTFQTVSALYARAAEMAALMQKLQPKHGTLADYKALIDRADLEQTPIDNAESLKKALRLSEAWEKEAALLLSTRLEDAEQIQKAQELVLQYKGLLCRSDLHDELLARISSQEKAEFSQEADPQHALPQSEQPPLSNDESASSHGLLDLHNRNAQPEQDQGPEREK